MALRCAYGSTNSVQLCVRYKKTEPIDEFALVKQEFNPYFSRLRYAYYGHNRPKGDGSCEVPKN